MSPEQLCPACGTAIPAGQMEGLCPRCLIRGAFDGEDGRPALDPTTPGNRGTGSFVPPTPEELAPAFPQLEILQLIGHGGMGAVYKARQLNLDRLVALKILRPESASDPAFAERFSREARTLAKLSHPHIVAVYDFGEAVVTSGPEAASAAGLSSGADESRQLYYIVMEFIDGVNLRDVLRSPGLTPAEALSIVPQICDALQYAHDEGVVHRDIKPENILLDRKGRVHIADFGLARLASRTAADFTLTDTHQVMGTPRYMAPEQMEASHTVDHRADIYSLGVVFYEMLTGETPVGHFDPPSKKVAVDVRLDEVVLRSLAREPERRYQHASDVRSDIESINVDDSDRHSASASATIPATDSKERDRRAAVGGRDWVVLTRRQIERDEIPSLCIVCGRPTYERINKTFEHTPDWAGLLGMIGLLAGFFPGLIILALTSRTMRVSCPVCPLHRGHWSRLAWVACTGWLLPVVLAAAGFFLVTAFTTRPGASIPAVVGGLFLGLVLYLVPVIYLASTRVRVEAITKDQIRLRRVSAAFARGVIDPQSKLPHADLRAAHSAAPAGPAEKHEGESGAARWRSWLKRRNRWFTTVAQIVLIAVFFVCLICYFSFSAVTTGGDTVDGELLRRTTVTFGFPDPWFEFVSNPAEGPGHRWKLDWISSSAGLMLVGFIAWCVLWQILKAQAASRMPWVGSPASVVIAWWILSMLAVLWGFHPLYIDQLVQRIGS